MSLLRCWSGMEGYQVMLQLLETSLTSNFVCLVGLYSWKAPACASSGTRARSPASSAVCIHQTCVNEQEHLPPAAMPSICYQ
jgi:hypothetical protein